MIIQETFTGSKFQGRKELDKLIKSVKSGDTIIFDSVSRMSPNADDGFRLYQELYNNGVELIFLKEPQLTRQLTEKRFKRKIFRSILIPATKQQTHS